MKKHFALLIEDNVAIAEQVAEFFAAHGWYVDYAQTGKSGVSLALDNVYDVIILDLNLPDIDGVEVCKQIKLDTKTTMPIIMLTARDAVDHKIEGFAAGADDYLTKPFNLRELIMRCQALSKRHNLHKDNRIQIAELEVELNSAQFTLNQQKLMLSPIGSKILISLAREYPRPVSRSTLLRKVWGDSPPDTDALKAHVYALRKTLNEHKHSLRLVTVPHLGYGIEVVEAKEDKDFKDEI